MEKIKALLSNPKVVLWTIVGLLVTCALAIAIALFVGVSKTSELAEAQIANEQLQLTNDQLRLANEYQALDREFAQYENQPQMLANDTLMVKYTAAKQKVERLLEELNSEKTKSAERIRELENEIATLKGIITHYLERIRELGEENEGLRAENQELKSDNELLTSQVQSVSQENVTLNERMALAEKLNVTGLTFNGLKKNGKIEKKIKKAKQLEVSFTITKNNSTPVGMKNLYLRITSPEGQLLGEADGATFEFEGGSLIATATKQVEYQGDEIADVKIYWNVNTTLSKGDYLVELFTDGYRLESRTFTMKK